MDLCKQSSANSVQNDEPPNSRAFERGSSAGASSDILAEYGRDLPEDLKRSLFGEAKSLREHFFHPAYHVQFPPNMFEHVQQQQQQQQQHNFEEQASFAGSSKGKRAKKHKSAMPWGQEPGQNQKTKTKSKGHHQCLLCPKAFSSEQYRKLHTAKVHEGKTDFKCHICHKVSYTQYILNQHILAVHTKDVAFECPICKSVSTSRASLKRHISSVHKNATEVGESPTHIMA